MQSHGYPIIGGHEDDTPSHNAVVALEMIYGGGSYGLCTGTLITPKVILTAAHCADGLSASSINIFFGRDISGMTPANTRHLADLLVHPDYDPGTVTNDLALLRLSGDPPGNVTPIPFLPHSKRLTSSDIGVTLEFVGFGQTNPSIGNSSGVKMHTTNQLNFICTQNGGCYYQTEIGYFQVSQNSICQDQDPGGICSGDSGGPALIKLDGQEYVAGVSSVSDEFCHYMGCSVKVDAFESFIVGFIGGPVGSSCKNSEDCISSFCVGGTCCQEDCNDGCHTCSQPGSVGTCQHLPDGTSCSDKDVCNGEESCQAGACTQGTPMDCSDGVGCTDDRCDPVTGCYYQPLVSECFDNNPCTEDICDAQAGCLHQNEPDGRSCGANKVCKSGQCKSLDSGSGCASYQNPSHGLLWLLLAAGLWGMLKFGRRSLFRRLS